MTSPLLSHDKWNARKWSAPVAHLLLGIQSIFNRVDVDLTECTVDVAFLLTMKGAQQTMAGTVVASAVVFLFRLLSQQLAMAEEGGIQKWGSCDFDSKG